VRVALLVTCVVDVFEPDVGEATVKVLRAAGCEVSVNLAQTCCGQPAWNSGFAEDAAAVARTTLDALVAELDGGAEAIVVPAGSCATMVRVFWPELFELAGDHEAVEQARRVGEATKELSEFLADRLDHLPPMALGRDVDVAYHHSCHMLRELRIVEQPGALLDQVAGCHRVPWAADERCCGFGGLFSMKLPETSEAMADDKLGSLATAHPDVVVGSDSTCLLHLRGRAEATGRPILTRHVAEVLAAALPAADERAVGTQSPGAQP
jgi:L-lactate dehydrogenase complex protein LldE